MTIKKIQGNLLAQPGIQVHGCNSHGVMGAGIANVYRRAYPDVYKAYRDVYEAQGNRLELGQCVIVASAADQFEEWAPKVAAQVAMWSSQLPKGTVVVNLVSQKDFGSDPDVVYVSYDALENGFAQSVAAFALASGMPVSFPLIGCGLAHGKWEEVAARIEKSLPDSVSKTLVVL